MIKRYGEIISSGFILIASIAYFIATFHFNEANQIARGSRAIPQVCAVILFFGAAAVLYGGLKTLKYQNSVAGKSNATPGKEGEREEEKPDYKKVAITLCLIALYASLFQRLGFILSTILYLILQMFTLAEKNERKSVVIIFISVITAVALYYVFTRAFSVILPSGTIF